MRDYATISKRLRQYSENCVAYKLDADFANAVTDAADAIEELLARDVVPTDFHERCLQLEIRKRIELEKQVPQWISVEERLPEENEDVLLLLEHNMVAGFWKEYDNGRVWFVNSGDDLCVEFAVVE